MPHANGDGTILVNDASVRAMVRLVRRSGAAAGAREPSDGVRLDLARSVVSQRLIVACRLRVPESVLIGRR